MFSLEHSIHQAYIFMRKNNHSIPDEDLEFIRDAALEKLREIENIRGCEPEIGENYNYNFKKVVRK